jgi:DedD protein
MADMTKQRLVGALLVLFVILIAATILVKNANDNVAETSEVDLPAFESSIETAESEIIEAEQETLLDPHDLGEDVAAAIEGTAVKKALNTAAEPVKKAITPTEQVIEEIVATSKPVVAETKPKPSEQKAIAKKPESKPVPKLVATPKPVVKTIATGPQWVIQLASFGVKDNALALQKKVKKLGYQSEIQSAKNSQGKLIHRLRIGPEPDNKKVDAIVSKVKQHLRLTPQIIKLQ